MSKFRFGPSSPSLEPSRGPYLSVEAIQVLHEPINHLVEPSGVGCGVGCGVGGGGCGLVWSGLGPGPGPDLVLVLTWIGPGPGPGPDQIVASQSGSGHF